MKAIKIYRDGDSMSDKATVGVFHDNDGSFFCVCFSVSRSFKTLAGAKRFMRKMGYEK